MSKAMGWLNATVAVVAVCVVTPAGAEGGFITYTESADVQGSLGQQSFNALMTLTLSADTSNITQSGAYHYTSKVTSATVTVDGLTATLLDPVYVFSGNNFAGFTDVVPITMANITLLDIDNPAFTNYDLTTPEGPLTGLAGGFGGTFSTTLGILDIGSYSGNGTFLATPASVPEPSSLALCGVASLIGLGLAVHRRMA